MSNKLLLLLILGVVFFSACSDDDKDPNYDGTYKDSGLELSRDGMVLSGKSVALSGNTLTLGNVIPGEPGLAIPVTITGSAVEGTSSNDFREVKVSGKIEGGKMNLTLAVKNKATDIEGTWAVGNLDAGIMATHFTFTTDKEKVKYGETEVAPENVIGFVNGIFGWMLPTFLRDITFTNDGNITASYNSDMNNPQYATSPKGMAFYNLVGGKLYISANITGIVEDIGRSTSDPLTEIMVVLEQGLPFEISKDTEKETMDVYMIRETLLPFMALLPMLGEVMPEEFQNYAGFITDLGPIIQEGKTAELGLVLTQKKTAE